MSPPPTFPPLLAWGSALAARSGRYPNRPGDGFDVPAVATTNPVSVTNNNGGFQLNAQAGVQPVAGSDHNLVAVSGGNGATNLINTLATDITDSEGGSGIAANEKTAGPGSTNGGAEEDNYAQNIRSTGLPSQYPVKKPRRSATKRKGAQVAKSGRATPETELPEPKRSTLSKRSALTLKVDRFATKAYKESLSLRPTTRPYKATRSKIDSGAAMGTSTQKPPNKEELGDLLRLLDSLPRPSRRTYFDTIQDTALIDRQIITGLKLSQDEDDEDTDGPLPHPKARGKGAQLFAYNGLNTNLRPMNDINEIFADLTQNALHNGLSGFLEALGSAKLKISTLCSGTESPLLALQMIQDSLKIQGDDRLQIEHQFSCEIEPYKQAYIQRNFRPAILFRDVVELKNDDAHTAFGARTLVPNDADIMVAGSSCVDYSPLNNKPKEFGTSGESYETLTATVEYAIKHTPTIVILENVLKFPWDKVGTLWHNAGYATKVAYLDSKDFYLPQTRQRGYMIGLRRAVINERHLNLDADAAVEKWFEVLQSLQRRASSSFTEFILADDDVQLQKFSQQAAVLLKTGKNVSWDKCRVECLSYRSCNLLGFKKPVTDWENNGSCLVPDYYNTLWFKRQVERIWDTIEINHLRSIAARSYDMAYKSRCIDLSQSCVRESDNKPWGIVGCITASANPYLTHRGGPLVGAEALSLQGIPGDKLILNRESSKQLVDLTGNAMTTTVVGAAMLAALISCSEVFNQPSTRQIKPLKKLAGSLEDVSPFEYDSAWLLAETDLTTDLRPPITVAEMRFLAFQSLRLCSCESLKPSTNLTFRQCSRCGHTSCVNCGLKPTHKYLEMKWDAHKQGTPAMDFEERIRQSLPPRLAIRGLLSALALAASICHTQFSDDYIEAVRAAAAEECRFTSIKRGRGWSIIYESQRSRLVLTSDRKWDGRVLCSENIDDLASTVTLQWRFYAKPKPELPANSQTRKDLLHPVARLTCSESLFDGQWEIRSVERLPFTLEVVGEGDKVASWEKNQGLENPLFKNRFVWSVLEFRLPTSTDSSAMIIPGNIIGKYDLLQDCGTACGSLHVKRQDLAAETQEPLFLFLDQTLLGNASQDSFVFANQHHRLGTMEIREFFAKVDARWRPSDTDKVCQVSCEVPGRWIPVGEVRLEEYAPKDLQKVHLATADTVLRINSTRCNTTGLPVIWCEFPMTKRISEELGLETRKHFELVKNRFALEQLSWLIKTAGHALGFADWQPLPVTNDLARRCTTCAPASPRVVWKVVQYRKGYQIRPFEDMKEACDYERDVKAAPEAATAELSYHEQSALAALKIDFNILTLVHKAVAALSESRGYSTMPSTVQWRAVVDHGHDYTVPFPQVQLKHCQDRKPRSQPPSFRRDLRESQLRSLDWMIEREEDPDHLWEEQEIVEALVAPMSLRLEAKVTARRKVMGGVLADDVGYGKTALAVAIIDHHFQKTKLVSSPSFNVGVDDMIALKATLILVPKNLVDQWEKEIRTCVGNTYNILKLTTKNLLEKSRVSVFREADIILTSHDIFDDNYFAELARMSRAHHTPVSAGRGFEEWFQMAQGDLKTLVKSSHGLDPNRLSLAWQGLKHGKDKYQRFVSLSKRNKKGTQTPPEAEGGRRPKKAKLEDLKVDDIELEEPTEPFLPLHGCRFLRLVVDEFNYLGSKLLPAIIALWADRRWILSGTPPHNTFTGVNTMAKLVGTTVGVSDDAELRYQKVKDGTRQVSGGEALRSYAMSRSPSYHEARHDQTIEFLDEFVRQNTYIIIGIERHPHYEMVGLTAPERALYHEGLLLLVNQSAKMGPQTTQKRSGGKVETTRTAHIVDHITASQSPEDALITLCSTMPEFARERSSISPCHGTIAEKESLIIVKVEDILSELRGAFWIMTQYRDEIKNIPQIYNYLRSVQENRFGDWTVRALLDLVITCAEDTRKWTVAKSTEDKKPKANAGAAKSQQHAMRSDPETEPLALSELSRIEELKLRADSLTLWTIALISVVRERRFFIGTKDCLSGAEIECSSCGCRSRDYSNMLFMGRCGHVGCEQCCGSQNGSLALLSRCPDQQCGSKTSLSSTIKASDLTTAIPSELVRQHGSKMVAISRLLSRIPKAEKVLIFAQFPRIIMALKAMLAARRIKFADTTKSSGAEGEVELFQKDSTCNVCVLQLDSVNAAGWNLQNANHVIFVSSFVAKTQHEFKSSITQAVGRVLRLGQEKDVHVYHLLAEKTIDVNVLEERSGRVVVERGGETLLVSQQLAGDRGGFGGLPFSGAACGAGEGEGEWEDEEDEEDEDEE